MKKLLIILPLTACISCKSVRFIPAESIRIETGYLDSQRFNRDSVHVTDSLIIRNKNDTVFVERTKTLWKERLVTDTAVRYIERTDTVKIPYEVEKPLTRWQTIKQDIGGVAIGVAGALIIFAIGRILRH